MMNRMNTLALMLAIGPINGPALDALNAARPDERNIDMLDEALDELHDEGTELRKVPVDQRTDAQNNRAKEIVTEFRRLRPERNHLAQLEEDSARRSRDVMNAVNGFSRSRGLRSPDGTVISESRGTEPATPWRDSAGRSVRLLNASHRLSDHASSVGQQNGESPRPGNLIKGMLTGNWQDAEVEHRYYNLSTATGSGVMIPELIGSMLIDLARAGSAVIRAGAGSIQMTAPKMNLVRVTSDPTIAAYAENAEISESDPGIDGVAFEAKKLGTMVRVSRELLYDSPNAGAMIEGILQTAMGAAIDQQALAGDGTGANWTGLLSMSGVNDVDAGGVQPSWDTWLEAVQAIEESNGTTAATVMSPAVKKWLSTLKDTTGRYLDPPAALDAVTRYTSTKLADTTATVGDFSKLLIGFWRDVELQFSGTAKDTFEKDQVLFRVLFRGDVAATHPAHLAKITDIDLATAPS